MTFDELLESNELREAVGDKFPVYQAKFRAIIDKAAIGDADLAALDDKQFVTKLRTVNGWNWASFFFSVTWYGYRQGHRWMEAAAGIILALILFSYLLLAIGVGDGLSSTIGLAIGIMAGLWGNNFYLISVANAVRHGTVPTPPTKGTNILIVILISIAISAGMSTIFAPLLGIGQPY